MVPRLIKNCYLEWRGEVPTARLAPPPVLLVGIVPVIIMEIQTGHHSTIPIMLLMLS